MDDALRAKSTPPTQGSHRKGLLVITPTTHCVVCGNTAYLNEEWMPGAGLSQQLRLYICKVGHYTYRACPRSRN